MNLPKANCRALALCFIIAGGCVSFDKSKLGLGELDAPVVSQAHTYWESRVAVIEDVANNGRPVPGIAGRLYFFGTEIGHPVKGKGAVAVDIYDATGGSPGPQTQPLIHVDFDAQSLDQLYRKDTIGWGYTLFLPWETYRSEVKRIQLNLRYTPAKGTPIFAPPHTITLRNEGNIPIQSVQVTGPGPGAASASPTSSLRPVRVHGGVGP